MTDLVDKGLSYAGEIEVTSVEVYSFKKEKVDISAQIIEMSIYEDLFLNTIHGTILIADSFDMIHNFPFIGEELINIKLKTPSMDETGVVDYNGYIYKISDRHYTSERGQVYLIHFTSYETIVDVNKKISKSFSGDISDSVKYIFENEMFLGSKKELLVEPTANKLKFVVPNWTPFQTINWLAGRALNKDSNSPSFISYETLDGKLKFTSLDTLYKQAPKSGIKYVYDHFKREPTLTGSVKNFNKDYNIIREVYVDEVFDYIKRAESGMYASRMVVANHMSKNIRTTTTDYLEDFKKTSHLSEFPVASKNLIRKSNSALYSIVNSEYVYDDQRNVRVSEWLAQRRSLMGQANEIFKVDITVSGRLDVHAGECVEIELSQMQPINRGDEKDQITNNYFKGKFLIGAIHHRIEGNNHSMIMQCFTDSLSKEVKINE